jgi:hypothetical protein
MEASSSALETGALDRVSNLDQRSAISDAHYARLIVHITPVEHNATRHIMQVQMPAAMASQCGGVWHNGVWHRCAMVQ